MQVKDYLSMVISTHVDTVFTGNGGWVVNILSALFNVKIVPCQNEQAASMAADAYARVKGFGVCISTAGPGFCNMINGIAGAYYDSTPMLVIVGCDSNFRTNNVRQVGFQEMDTIGIAKTFCKKAIRIKKAKDILKLPELIRYAKSGRPAPILIEIPDNIQREYICS